MGSIMPPPICLGHLRRTQARPARLRSGLMPKQWRSVSRFNMFCMVARMWHVSKRLRKRSTLTTCWIVKVALGQQRLLKQSWGQPMEAARLEKLNLPIVEKRAKKIEPATDNTGNGEGSSEVLLDFGDDGGPCKTIRELLCKSPAADSYTTMCELWKNSETVNSNEGVSMTVFIPTDAAFATLSDLLDQADVELDIEANEKILMFHATPGMVLSTHLDCTGTLEMFDGGSSRTKCGKANQVDYLIQKGSGNRKNDMEPIIIAADIMACDNSVIHIVSEVLLP